jgi:non-ribosomal peptide synthetase-like protein
MKSLSKSKREPVMEPALVHIQETDLLRRSDAAEIEDEASVLAGVAPRRMHYFFERQAAVTPDAVAVVAGSERLTYGELDARANRLARYLISKGAGPGRTVGILLERSPYTYVSVLAVLKAGAAYVPLDPSYPADRVAFIAGDAGLTAILTTSDFSTSACEIIALDQIDALLSKLSSGRIDLDDSGDELAYIIYTSGTTGRPKGVAITHSNVTHFLNVVAPIYGVSASDRVYQGITIAFDFSIEEIWLPWIAGATVVAGPNDSRRIGSGLAEFLIEQGVTVLCCVPTLLATIDRDLPAVRILIVGGETCPRDLVDRWYRLGRRMLNTYGPTETTVTATWCEVYPGKPVTIGCPLPGYTAYILDEKLEPVPHGEAGEIVIGGPAVARGYINRPELNDVKFIGRPYGRLYRSGDLGRFTADGEIDFLGRIDTQVKIRGFRIEVGEVEAVILENAAVKNAIVTAVPKSGPAQDLAAFITLRDRDANIEQLKNELADQLRRRVPVYMVPAYIETLDAIPVLASGKADRKALPEPASRRIAVRAGDYVEPATDLERRIASMWEAVFGQEKISVTADFFLDLGGHSMFAARVVSRLRERPEFRRLSIADLYGNPTIRSLAAFVEQSAAQEEPKESRPQPIRHTDARVWRSGLLQFALLYTILGLLGAPVAYFFARHRGNVFLLGIHDLLVPVFVMVLSFALPVLLKWLLIGRFRAGSHPLWGWYYARWWAVRKALDFSPAALLAGSPLINVYARLLGAKIGRGAHIATSQLHLADLIQIGDGASIGYEADIQPFVIEDGWLHMAPIRIGAGAFVGTKAVILAGAEIGPNARVPEQTLVTRNQKIAPSAGSPDPLLDSMEKRSPGTRRISGWLWAAFAMGLAALEALPILAALPGLLVIAWAARHGGAMWAAAMAPVAALMFVFAICILVWLGKRLAMPHAEPGIYPIASWFGFRKWMADRMMAISLTVTNTLYATLFTGPWLRTLGARIGNRSEVSTVAHLDPDLLTLGNETFVADLASIGAATFHNGYVSMQRTGVGDRTFLGNACVVRSDIQLPDNCLIGVQSVAPAVTPQSGTSWLGSPALFLPRRQPSGKFGEDVTYKPRTRLVAYRYFVEFFRIVLPPTLLFLLGVLVLFGCVRLRTAGSLPLLLAGTPALYFAAAFAITLIVSAFKWTIIGRYRQRVEPLWAPFVRHSELVTGLYESAAVPTFIGMMTGTPFVGPLLGLFGAKIGRRVYLDTTFTTEFDLVRVGDDSCIGQACSLQTHLFEDRVMKMSTVDVGDRCAVGPRSVILYDASVGDDAKLDGLSLVMKGESIPAGTSWRGIPARLAG